MNVAADVFVDGKKHAVTLQDLSRTGMFLRTTGPEGPALRVGNIIHVALATNGKRVVAAARVTHALDEIEAKKVGRVAGVGVQLCAPMRPADHQFNEAVARIVDRCAQRTSAADRRIVVAEPDTRLLEHLSSVLGEAGFIVSTATNGMEALSACMRRAPDVIVLARDMPIVDGYRALGELQRHPRLASVPVILTSDDPGDLVDAFHQGAMDFIARPFTSVELVLRARRLAHVVAPAFEPTLDGAELIDESEVTSPVRAMTEPGIAAPRMATGTIPPPLPTRVSSAVLPPAIPTRPSRPLTMPPAIPRPNSALTAAQPGKSLRATAELPALEAPSRPSSVHEVTTPATDDGDYADVFVSDLPIPEELVTTRSSVTNANIVAKSSADMDFADVAAAVEQSVMTAPLDPAILRGTGTMPVAGTVAIEALAAAASEPIAQPVSLAGSGRTTDGETWQPGRERIVLRGDLAELSLPSLLSLLEQERKSGRLALVRDRETASIEVSEGRIVGASGSQIHGDARTVLMALLDWTAGEFVLTSMPPQPRGPIAIALTHLLLEHARIRDEAARDARPYRALA
jgi:CheY-like chemotaxis protein